MVLHKFSVLLDCISCSSSTHVCYIVSSSYLFHTHEFVQYKTYIPISPKYINFYPFIRWMGDCYVYPHHTMTALHQLMEWMFCLYTNTSSVFITTIYQQFNSTHKMLKSHFISLAEQPEQCESPTQRPGLNAVVAVVSQINEIVLSFSPPAQGE